MRFPFLGQQYQWLLCEQVTGTNLHTLSPKLELVQTSDQVHEMYHTDSKTLAAILCALSKIQCVFEDLLH